MAKCSFCGKEYSENKGVVLVNSVSGKITYLCSSKCRKNFEMKRKKRKWTNPDKKAKKE